jgi:hypothetical protein
VSLNITWERQQRRNAFILRIWWEEDDHPLWRGWVQHTGTGESRYVQHLGDLLAFLEERTGPLAQAPDRTPMGREEGGDNG